jgi:hypothetical protein
MNAATATSSKAGREEATSSKAGRELTYCAVLGQKHNTLTVNHT